MKIYDTVNKKVLDIRSCAQNVYNNKKNETKNIALWPFNQKYNKHKSTGNLKVMPKM